ncbi:MAG: aldo/keto reductase [Treponema sp.]|nr:aldo/keto reductase [Treponema sp.]
MEYVRLGKTNLLISRVAFGAMRLAKIGQEVLADENALSVASIVRKAYESGINFFDTTHKVPESEKLLGEALYDIRRNVFIATTTNAKTSGDICRDLDDSLMTLHCDTVDLYQFETEKFLPMPGGADKIYDTLTNLKEQGKINHIGIVTTNIETAEKAVRSGLYETLQFPFSLVSSQRTEELSKLCLEMDVGFIAMQPLGGGVIENLPLAFGYLRQFENVVPIWGIKKQEELDQLLYFNEHPPVIDEQFHADAEQVRNFFN